MACLIDLKIKILQEREEGCKDINIVMSPADEGDSTEDEWNRPPAIERLNSAPGGSIAGLMRGLVSQQKTRFKEGEVDLDLSYITSRILAMGFPSCGTESFYRNPIDQVEAFLESKHGLYCRVYNLCSERKYDSRKRFAGNWAVYPFEDHHPPMPFSLIQSFVNDASTYLDKNSKNVIAVHCKAGKSRTGVMICCLLLSHFPGMCPNADSAIALFASKRTNDNVAVNIPSQLRYIRYFESSLSIPRKTAKRVRIHKIQIQGSSNCGINTFKIRVPSTLGAGTKVIFNSKRHWKSLPQPDSNNNLTWDLEGRSSYGFDDRGVLVQGDVKIVFKSAKKIGGEPELFRCCINTMFHEDFNDDGFSEIILPKHELDRACKDICHKKFSSDMKLIITLSSTANCSKKSLKLEDKRIRFKDTDGDMVTLMSGGTGSGTILYSVNNELRDPVKVVLLDQSSPNYLLFPEIDKGIHLPETNRRFLLKQLSSICEYSSCEHNIPELDVIGATYDTQQCCNASLPCTIPALRLHFDARRLLTFQLPAVPNTTLTVPALIASSDIVVHDVQMTSVIKPLKQYALSINKCCSKLNCPIEVTVRDMSQTLSATKSGLLPMTFTVCCLDNLVWELRCKNDDEAFTVVSRSGVSSVELPCCGQCEIIYTQLDNIPSIQDVISHTSIKPVSWSSLCDISNEVTSAWKPFIGVGCEWVDPDVQTLENLISTLLRNSNNNNCNRPSITIVFALSSVLTDGIFDLLSSLDPLSTGGIFVFGSVSESQLKIPNNVLISDHVSTTLLNNTAILLCEWYSGTHIEFCS